MENGFRSDRLMHMSSKVFHSEDLRVYFTRNSVLWLLVTLILVLSGIFCGVDVTNRDVDHYALWKEQPNEKIVFMSKADSPDGELYLLDKNGKITRLTNNDRHENNPALSFDGSRIAFHAGDAENMLSWEIYILDIDTGEESRLTTNTVIDGHPDWSPDDSKIVFSSFRDA